MVIRQCPHFNPVKHNLNVKVAIVRKGFHRKHNINYHIIWTQKYIKTILKDKVVEVLRTIIERQFQQMQCEKLALEIMPGNIHLFLGAKPTNRSCDIIHQLKGNTSMQLRRYFPDLKYLEHKQHFGKCFDALWATGYYCGSAGHVRQDAVRRYIAEQQGEDVFEYSVFGDITGQTKIGDFTGYKIC